MTEPGSDFSGIAAEFEYNGAIPVKFNRDISTSVHRYYSSQSLKQYHLNIWTKEKFDEFYSKKLAEVNVVKQFSKPSPRNVEFNYPLISLDGDEFSFSEKELFIWVFVPAKAPHTEQLRAQLQQWERDYGTRMEISIISSVPARWPSAEWRISTGVKLYSTKAEFLNLYKWNKDEIQIAWIDKQGKIVSQFNGYHPVQAEEMEKRLLERMK